MGCTFHGLCGRDLSFKRERGYTLIQPDQLFKADLSLCPHQKVIASCVLKMLEKIP